LIGRQPSRSAETPASAMDTPTIFSLPRRRLHKADISLPMLGFGSSSLGNLYRPISDKAATGLLQHALDLGMAYVDTAPHYGHGLAERRIGMVSYDGILSTKVGRRLKAIAPPPAGTERHGFVDADPYEPVFDYSYDGVMRSFEDSCRRLRRERIDILLAHDLGEMTHGADHPSHFRAFLDGGYRALVELKASGQVGAIGLGVNEWQVCEAVMSHADLDIVLLAGRYTLLEQGAVDRFLPACERRGIDLVIGGPFNSGVLVDRDRYDYQAVPPAVAARVAELRAVCRAHDVPLAAAALQFPLGHPNVASVIPGMGCDGEVEANLRHFMRPIPGVFWDDLKSLGLLHAKALTPGHLRA